MSGAAAVLTPPQGAFEPHRRELTAYCYRMLGSPFDAEDAVQDTLLRAWKSADGFEGRAAVRTWLYRIATNVCIDMVQGREKRARPMEIGPSGTAESALTTRPEVTWLEPMPMHLVAPAADPAELAQSNETIRLAFVAALQHLPPRQRAVLILCEVLRWKAAEVAELLDMTVASVNSALQRARATLDKLDIDASATDSASEAVDQVLLDRFVDAFQRYDMDELVGLIREDAIQSMPPFELWLQGAQNIIDFWCGPGHGCRGSIVRPVPSANGAPTFAQWKPAEDGDGYTAWALQVLDFDGDRVGEFTFFLSVDRLFPLWDLPLRLAADGSPVAG